MLERRLERLPALALDGGVRLAIADRPIARLAGLAIDRKMFLHINNSNPALLPGSIERKAAEEH